MRFQESIFVRPLISWEKRKHNYLPVFFIALAYFSKQPAFGQTSGAIEGTVVSEVSGESMPGVNVMLVGTVLGTVTDLNGHFLLNHIPAGSYQMRVSMMGYKTIEKKAIQVQADKTTSLSFKLVETVIETPELIVTANKTQQNIQDSPNSVGVMTSRDLQQRSEVYLDKLLEYASGVNFIGSQVNIRGSSGFNYGAGSRVLFLVDGVPVMPGDSGDIKWDLIPATQVERVEIVKGAGSALYGSSALGGVVNIVTKEASAKPTTNIRFSAGAYDRPRYAEWRWTDRLLHFDDLDVDHTRRLGKSELFLAVGRHQSTGYAQTGNYQRMNASAKIHTRLNGRQNLTISSNYEGGDRGTGLMWRSQRYALEVDPEAISDYVTSNKFGLNAFHHWVANKNLGLKTRLSYFRNYWKNYFHDNITGSLANRYGLEIQGDYQFSEDNALTFGTEESWDHVNSDLVGKHDQYVLSGYMQNERKLLSTLSLTIGLRYDYQNVDVGFRDSEWSPKIGLVWHAQSYLVFRASSGKGFRAASMSERFSDSIYSGLRIVPNVNLRSETAWSHEIGFNYNPLRWLYLDVAGFVSDYWDLIEPQPDETQTIQFINVTRARISGAEVNLKANPWLKGLSFDLGYTFMEPRDLHLDEVLAYRPKHLFTGTAVYSLGRIDLAVDYRYASRLESVKLYPQDDRVAQKTVNARVALRMSPWTITATANNVFNHNHTQMERTLLPIRHYVLTVSTAL